MNQDCKIECYQKTFQTLKEYPEIKNLTYPEKKENLEFSCDIGECHTEYNMRLNVDFLTIRASRVYEGKSDSQLTELAQQLTQGTDVKFTAYNETIIFQLSLPLVGIADEDAKNLAIQEAKDFYQFLFKIAGFETNISQEYPLKESTVEIESSAPRHSEAKETFSNKKHDGVDTKTSSKEKTSQKRGILPARIISSKVKQKRVEDSESSSFQSTDSEVRESRKDEMEYLIVWKRDLEKKEDSLKQKEESLNEKESILENKSIEIERQEQAIKQRFEEVHSDRAAFEEKDSEIESLKQDIRHSDEKNLQLQAAVQQYRKEIENLKSVVEQKEALIDSNGKWATSLEEEKRQLLEQLQNKELELESIQNEQNSENITTENTKIQIEELESTVQALSQRLEAEQNRCREISQKCQELEHKNQELLQKKSLYKKSVHDQKQIISELESRLQEYRENSSIEMPDELIQDFADARKENRRLRREVEDLKAEHSSSEATLLEEISKYQTLMKDKEKELEQMALERTPEVMGQQILKELSSAGILMTEEQTEHGICLTGKRDQCDIIISVSEGTILCKKSLLRPQKYKNELQRWNEEEVTEAYYIQKKDIVCKKTYHNALMDLNRVLRKFTLLH